jgi:hypothetical protein
MLSILTDIGRSHVLDLMPERKLTATMRLFETLTTAQRISTKSEAMVMWPELASALSSRCSLPAAIGRTFLP